MPGPRPTGVPPMLGLPTLGRVPTPPVPRCATAGRRASAARRARAARRAPVRASAGAGPGAPTAARTVRQAPRSVSTAAQPSSELTPSPSPSPLLARHPTWARQRAPRPTRPPSGTTSVARRRAPSRPTFPHLTAPWLLVPKSSPSPPLSPTPRRRTPPQTAAGAVTTQWVLRATLRVGWASVHVKRIMLRTTSPVTARRIVEALQLGAHRTAPGWERARLVDPPPARMRLRLRP